MTGSPRLVAGGVLEPPGGLALDEALVRSPHAERALAVWRTSSAVVIGRFQRPDWEVDPAACAARGVRVWRRFSGGGAVYLDPGVVCAALAVPSTDAAAAAGVPAMYAPFLAGMTEACRWLGVDAVADDRTVRVGGRKVTGIAAHRGRAVTLVHGTLLVDADLDALRGCLAGPRGGDLQGAPHPTMSRPDHVANVGGSVQDAEAAIAAAFAAQPSEPPGVELREAADRLQAARYREPAWHAGPWAEVCDPAVTALLGLG